MKQAVITLKDGRIFTYENNCIWGYTEQLNDNRTPFIEIGKYTLRKDEISTIEIIDLAEKKENK